MRQDIKWLLLLIAVIGGAAATVLLYFVPPGSSSIYPRCQLNYLTGLHCPGCGGTRCLHALLHGEVAQAAAYNVMALVLVPGFAAWLGYGWFEVFRGRPFPVWISSPVFFRCFVICFLAFGILRNIPFYPFNILAPHTL